MAENKQLPKDQVKFVRVRGKVVPIKKKGAGGSGMSKRGKAETHLKKASKKAFGAGLKAMGAKRKKVSSGQTKGFAIGGALGAAASFALGRKGRGLKAAALGTLGALVGAKRGGRRAAKKFEKSKVARTARRAESAELRAVSRARKAGVSGDDIGDAQFRGAKAAMANRTSI